MVANLFMTPKSKPKTPPPAYTTAGDGAAPPTSAAAGPQPLALTSTPNHQFSAQNLLEMAKSRPLLAGLAVVGGVAALAAIALNPATRRLAMVGGPAAWGALQKYRHRS